MKVRVNFTIEESLLDSLDLYCEENYSISRSTAISAFVCDGISEYYRKKFNGDVDKIAAYQQDIKKNKK